MTSSVMECCYKRKVADIGKNFLRIMAPDLKAHVAKSGGDKFPQSFKPYCKEPKNRSIIGDVLGYMDNEQNIADLMMDSNTLANLVIDYIFTDVVKKDGKDMQVAYLRQCLPIVNLYPIRADLSELGGKLGKFLAKNPDLFRDIRHDLRGDSFSATQPLAQSVAKSFFAAINAKPTGVVSRLTRFTARLRGQSAATGVRNP